MKKIKIIGIASPICWWIKNVGDICPVLDIYEPTGFIKIQIMHKEEGFDPYPLEGWIDSQYVEVIE